MYKEYLKNCFLTFCGFHVFHIETQPIAVQETQEPTPSIETNGTSIKPNGN